MKCRICDDRSCFDCALAGQKRCTKTPGCYASEGHAGRCMSFGVIAMKFAKACWKDVRRIAASKVRKAS